MSYRHGLRNSLLKGFVRYSLSCVTSLPPPDGVHGVAIHTGNEAISYMTRVLAGTGAS